ncbi:MAG: hypothetical protein GX282_05305 [Campylobacteraceae bacterium]|nr:hypothetical protein [Campylobacteraceae bacterium]
MRKIICFLLLALGLNAATLMTYEVVENVGNVDLKLSFDSPFDGEIFQTKEDGNLKIILKNTASSEKFTAQLRSNIISSFVIDNSKKDEVEINIKGTKGLKATAGILEGGLMLSINFEDETLSSLSFAPEPAKEDKSSSFKTIILVLIFLVLAAIIFVVFKKIKAQKESFDIKFNDPFENNDFMKQEISKEEDIFEQSFEQNFDQTLEEKKFEEEQESIYSQIYEKSSVVQDGSNIVYQTPISEEKDLLLIEKDGNIHLIFLSKENEIPRDIYEKMIDDRDKFNEFLEICKNKDSL